MAVDPAASTLGPIGAQDCEAACADPALAALPGRQQFLEHLASLGGQADGQEREVMLALVSADELDRIAGSLGAQSGDAILGQLAQRLAALAGPGQLVARIDRDELALVAPAQPSQDAMGQWSAELSAWLRQPYHAAGLDIAVPASVGVAQGPVCGAAAWALLRSAELAQFVARASGGDRVSIYRPTVRSQLRQRVQECLRAGNFTLHVQPILSLAAPRQLVGVECLLRWRHPTRGLLFPPDFRPLFEDPDVAPLIADFVVREAAAQARRWLDRGVDFGQLSINVAVAWLRLPDMLSTMTRTLAAARLPAGCLALELPEDLCCAPDLDRLTRRMAELRAAGVALLVDGWALGMTPPAALAALPVAGLKLDRSLLSVDRQDMLAALVAEARAHGLSVIAEGVETEEQAARLLAAGCERAQGWLFARPMPGSKLPAFCERLAQQAAAAA
jgi:diguanylate cyclase (GGDEF)-like protein